MEQAEPGLSVRYVSGFSGGIERYTRHRPLGIIAFGNRQGQPDFFLHGALAPAAGEGALEVWQIADEVEDFGAGRVIGARSRDYAFGAIEILEDPALSMEASMEYAYRELLIFLNRRGCRILFDFGII